MGANLFAQYLQPARSVMDYMGDMDAQDLRRAQLEGAQRQNALAALVARQQQQEMAYTDQGRNLIREVYARNPGASLEERAAALEGTGHQAGISQADALRKAALDRRNTEAGIGKTTAETDEKKRETAEKKRKEAIQWVMSQSDPAIAEEAINQGVRDGSIGMATGSLMLKTLPKDPAAFRSWQIRMSAGLAEPAKMAELLMPLIQTNNTGGFTTTQAVDKITGKPTIMGQVRNTQSPDSVASVGEQRRHNQETEKRLGESSIAEGGGPSQVAFVKQFGKPAPGYRWKADGSQEAIPGGPADIKAGEQGARKEAAKAASLAQADSVLKTIEEAKPLVGWTTAGPGGLAASLPSTTARDLQAKLGTIKANLGFDRLQQMREASPTGGALGQVAVQELMALQSTVASLDQLQSPGEVRNALGKIEKHYKAWQKTLDGGGTDAAPRPGAAMPKPSVSNW
jgi:hypothetical protein